MIKDWIAQEKFVYIDDFISEETRQWAMNSLRHVAWEAGVITYKSGKSEVSDKRICSQLKEHSFPPEIQFLLADLRGQVCALLGVDRSHCDRALVVRYGPGGKFDPHLDTGLNAGNERQYSVLVTLQEPLAGGETSFIRLKQQVPSKNGRTLIWDNLDADGQPSSRMLHAGSPVLEGEKYILVFWLRQNPL